jgi:hypothetical protein
MAAFRGAASRDCSRSDPADQAKCTNGLEKRFGPGLGHGAEGQLLEARVQVAERLPRSRWPMPAAIKAWFGCIGTEVRNRRSRPVAE